MSDNFAFLEKLNRSKSDVIKRKSKIKKSKKKISI